MTSELMPHQSKKRKEAAENSINWLMVEKLIAYTHQAATDGSNEARTLIDELCTNYSIPRDSQVTDIFERCRSRIFSRDTLNIISKEIHQKPYIQLNATEKRTVDVMSLHISISLIRNFREMMRIGSISYERAIKENSQLKSLIGISAETYLQSLNLQTTPTEPAPMEPK